MKPCDPAGSAPVSLSLHRLKRLPRPPESNEARPSILKIGRNVWRVAEAHKVAFLIDADAFFRAFAEACSKAEKQIIIVGWDTDSRTELPRPDGGSIEGRDPEGGHLRLGRFLSDLVARKPNLNIYVLSWDFAFIYLFEREALPGVKFSSLGDGRIRFVLDQNHPTWAAHHQKIVVIDDRVAFSGGLDITQRRWDTPEHLGYDERRVDPGGHSYGPFHDVQVCVQGDAAKVLGDLVRERWYLATKEKIEPPTWPEKELSTPERDPWPRCADVALSSVRVGISRTLPFGFRREPSGARSRPVLEVERLFIDSIRSAKRFIYIENQYFTSPLVAKAIARRLRERDGPEVVMVLPRDATGWIEEGTMGLLRSRALRIVEEADRYGRFRCYHPVVPDLGEGYVKVHSKVMIVDDEWVRIGSANLNNRSMGLDTECDLIIEALGRRDVREANAALRKSLLGEHLGVDPGELEARFLINGSLVETVESFRGGERTLVEIRSTIPEWVGRIMPPGEWIDPVSPYGIRRWFGKRLHKNRHTIASVLIFGVTIGLLVLLDLEKSRTLPRALENLPSPQQIAWEGWSWIQSWSSEKTIHFLSHFKSQAFDVPLILVGFVMASLLFFPITGLIVGVAFVYPPALALALIFSASLISALASYGVGRYWAWTKSGFLQRPWVRTLSSELERGGVWAVTAIRLTPIAPFTAVSLVAGGLRIRLRDYIVGTFLGLLPGTLAATLISKEASDVLSGPGAAGAQDWASLLGPLLLIASLLVLTSRALRRYRSLA